MAPLAIVAIAFAVRAAVLLIMAPPFVGEQWHVATALIAERRIALDGVPTARFEPLYPLFLAAVRLLVGDSPAAVQWTQSAVASIGGGLLFALTSRLAGSRRTGWIAGLLFAVHPLLTRHAATASETALLTTLLLAGTLLTFGARSVGGGVLAGLALGCAVLTRSMVLPSTLCAAGWLVTQSRRAAAVGLVSALAVSVMPMAAWNMRVHGSPLPSRHGVNLFIGNSRYTAHLLPKISPDVLQDYADRVAAQELGAAAIVDTGMSDRADRALARRAWAEMSAHPVETLVLKIRNIWYFFSPQLVPSRLLTPATRVELKSDGTAAVSDAAPRPVAQRLAHGLARMLVLPAAVAGVWLRRRRWLEDGLLWGVLATFVAVHALYFPATRYTPPAVVVLLFFAAVALDRALHVAQGTGAFAPGHGPRHEHGARGQTGSRQAGQHR